MNEKDILEFARTVGKLKEIKRAGWVKRGISNPESIADHSFRAAVIGMALSDKEGMDTEKVIRMLLLHDIEEAITGDIPHPEKIKMDKERLKALQKEAIEKILLPLSTDIKEKYLSLFEEFEECNTVEAKFCRDVEKLEMMLQVDEYQRANNENKEKLDAFWKEAKDICDVPRRIESVVKIFDELEKER